MQIRLEPVKSLGDADEAVFASPYDAARAAQAAGWCWPRIEGEPDSLPLLVAADILADHLRSGDEVLLCSADGARFVRLVPVG
jgi:hypothetical protein